MSYSQKGSGRGASDADNEMAGRFLLVAVAAIAGALFLAIAPILIAGFLIGLTWYGAYMEDGEPNGERIVWPVCITLVVFIYFLGVFPPLDRIYQGVLFTDFDKWTGHQVSLILDAVDEILPRKLMIHSVTIHEVRIYGWSVFLSSIASFVFLQIKGAGRGVFLYRGCHFALQPFRAFAVQPYWILAASVVSLVLALVFKASWLGLGSFIMLSLMAIYAMGVERVVKASVSGAPEKAVGPIQLGHEKGKPNKRVMLTDDQLNHHVHIVGASGFGKSVLLSHVVKNRISTGHGMLFVDLKADFETIRQVVSSAKASGRLEDLYIFSCGNPEFSSPYNVVATGTANQLKDRIMGALNWSEEFYKNEASSFLLKLLRGLVIKRDFSRIPFDLSTILKCAEDPRSIASLIDELPESEAEIRAQLEGLVTHLSRSENQRALQGLRSQLESLLLSDFGHLLAANPSGIDLFGAMREGKIVYVLLDSRTYGESSRALGKLILQDLKAASARIDNEVPRDERTAFSVIVDEFADLATEDFIGFLDRARSSKIGVVVAHQEIADLSRISPEFARRLMNATSTLFAFLQKLPDSSELIGGISGTRKAKEVTEQAKSNWLFGDEKTGMKSIKEVDEFVIHPNVIRSLAVGECVLVQKYPTSKSAVVKVKPEIRDYLSESEVANALEGLGYRHKVTETKTVRQRAVPLPPAGSGELARKSAYWSGDSEES